MAVLRMRELLYFKDRHAGEIAYVVGCGPSLHNWPPAMLAFSSAFYINTSIHYVLGHKLSRGTYRVVYDWTSIKKYLDMPHYKHTPKVVAPVHTFLPYSTFDNLGVPLLRFMAGTTWTLFGNKYAGQFNRPIGENGKHLWRPTMFTAFSLAIWMGFSEVRLVGVDLHAAAPTTHWDAEKDINDLVRIQHQNLRTLNGECLTACERYGLKITRLISPDVEIPLDEIVRTPRRGQKGFGHGDI